MKNYNEITEELKFKEHKYKEMNDVDDTLPKCTTSTDSAYAFDFVNFVYGSKLTAELTYRRAYDKRYPQAICRLTVDGEDVPKFYYNSDTGITLFSAKQWAQRTILEYLQQKQKQYSDMVYCLQNGLLVN